MKAEALRPNFKIPLSLDFVFLLKIAVITLFGIFFFFEIDMWQTILSKNLYYKKTAVLLFSILTYFAIYNIKNFLEVKKIILIMCLLDIVFLTAYSFYTPLPLNLYVGLLSLNILVAGMTASITEMALVVGASIFAFTCFLSFKDLLGGGYSGLYFILNSLSFSLYGAAAIFLQDFFWSSRKEVDALSEQLMVQEKHLEEAKKLSAIGTLSAGLAHEIRNPLAGISGSIELIKEGHVDEKDSKKLFNTVLREIDRLNLLVTDFLGFAQPEVILNDKIEIKKFTTTLVEFLDKDPRSEGIDVEVNCAEAELWVDQNKLRQVFINLIVNAFQAFPKKWKEKNTSCKVKIHGEQLDSGYRIKVEDNGMGIKKSDLDKIFEPFHTTKDKGTGLGLALSHRILSGHGASISAASEPGIGTVFTIVFDTEKAKKKGHS